ncbi:MAG: hypothetical protein IIW10_04540 [Spirochaetaceae bacterium]|nr:hypothetical protein [Spirochaetaceae bacterium]
MKPQGFVPIYLPVGRQDDAHLARKLKSVSLLLLQISQKLTFLIDKTMVL